MSHSHQHGSASHEDGEESAVHCHAHCHGDGHGHHAGAMLDAGRMGFSFVLLAVGIWLGAAGVGWFAPWWVRCVWYLVAFVPVGWSVIREAVESACQGDVFSEFMLMSVAAVGAFAIGEYPEAVAVMLFYCVGEALQDKAVARAQGNIRSLMTLCPDHANVVGEDGVVRRMDPAEVEVGSVVEVRPGERVPLDGQLLTGEALLDTAALTGESVPRLIPAGGEALAGMIASDATLRLRTTRPAADSAVSRVLRMVQDAQERKSPTERFIHRFARVYTPIVMGLAVLVAVVPWGVSLLPWGFTYSFATWFFRALIFLVISCPCALVISIPLSYFAGIGAASRLGILFKGGHCIDAAAQVDTVAFDKTGTLTTGQFSVREDLGLSEADLRLIAAMERDSLHPIARAVVDYVSVDTGDIALSDVRNIPGYGLSATCGGEAVLVGTPRLLEREGVEYPEDLDYAADTLVVLARGGRYVGHLLLADTEKDDALSAVGCLTAMGVRSAVLSGDSWELTNRLAQQLGIGTARGDLLPQQKVECVQDMQREGRHVAFVGDGINDAPVLAMSDVGMAMGGLGTDMAIETADVVIQGDQPSRVADALRISRFTRAIARQNIALAIGLKALIMLLGVVGLASMWAAVFADVGVALLCVLNATRVFSASRG